MFTKFLHRPVLGIVLSILTVFVGLLSIKTLPISQFPDIAPPRVLVLLSFPGASAEVLVKSSITILEQAINGVQGMRYMISDATSSGDAVIQVYFEPGTDPNDALVQVKTRVDQMMYRLPELVRLEGILVQPVQPSMLLYVNLYSTDPKATEKFLFNYATVYVIPELKRIHGVGQVKILGARQFAMRIWLNPDRMRAYGVGVEEVMKAVESQSIIARPGRLGSSSGKTPQSLEYTITYEGQYNKPEQYENIIVRAKSSGELLYLKDIAKVELDSEFYNIYSDVNGYPAAAIMFKQTEGSNAKEVIQNIKQNLEELKKSFPPGMDYKFSYDVSNFIDASIERVVHTLYEAFVLVAIVVFLFLGDFRSTLIPSIAVPISLIGAFAVMKVLGLTINLITLFALVLAIGVVVDDAIVVVEAVHAKMEDKKNLTIYGAVKLVLSEISGAVIAITILMMSVFVPVSFLPGPVGGFYRQFAITMASAIGFSGIIALTLTPVLCAMILKPHSHHQHKHGIIGNILEKFNHYFAIGTNHYIQLIQKIANKRLLTLGLIISFSLGILILSKTLPSGFVPGEDQGMIYAVVQTPPGSTIEKTYSVTKKLEEVALKIEGVDSVATLAGFEILTEGEGSNAGTCLINLKDWSQRKHSVHEIMEELEEKTKDFGAIIEFFEPPAVPGFGAAGGVSFRLLDKTNSGDYHAFDEVHQEFMINLRNREELTGLFSFYSAKYPQFLLKIDQKIAMQKGVDVGKAMENLNILVGSTYEQGFVRFNQFFKVYLQALPEFRRFPSDILQLYTPNEKGEMVPYSSFISLEPIQGANEITRYNAYTSSVINTLPAKGYTTGDVIQAIREVAKELPKGYTIAWEGLSYDEANRGNEAFVIFLVVLVFVYLVLSAQYESFIIPFAVILSLPPGIFGSFFLLKIMGLANDVYAQIGMIMLVGLLGKNAVLIVEFARQRQEVYGLSVLEAAIEGAKARFRPILMTSFAFIAGLIPLLVSGGPVAIANHTIGACALGGMLIGTIFGVIVVPGLYYIFGSIAEGKVLYEKEELLPLSELSTPEELSKTWEKLEQEAQKKGKGSHGKKK